MIRRTGRQRKLKCGPRDAPRACAIRLPLMAAGKLCPHNYELMKRMDWLAGAAVQATCPKFRLRLQYFRSFVDT